MSNQAELFEGYRPLIWHKPRHKKQTPEQFQERVKAVLEAFRPNEERLRTQVSETHKIKQL